MYRVIVYSPSDQEQVRKTYDLDPRLLRVPFVAIEKDIICNLSPEHPIAREFAIALKGELIHFEKSTRFMSPKNLVKKIPFGDIAETRIGMRQLEKMAERGFSVNQLQQELAEELPSDEKAEEISRMRIISWNVNGLSGLLKQDGNIKHSKPTIKNPLQKLLNQYNPDILCLQEIKLTKELDVRLVIPALNHHYIYWNRAQTSRGYSGTMVASRIKPFGVFYDLPTDIVKQCDEMYGNSTRLNTEGRLIALYFNNFTLLNVYSPNAGFGLKRLKERIGWWEKALNLFIERLQTGIHKELDGTITTFKREVIVVGDLNVIPDLKLDRLALQYQDGSTKEERECFHNILKERQLVDSFRYLHPTQKFWTWVPAKFWDKNFMGCRIDFVLVEKDRAEKVEQSTVLVHQGSDHRPIIADIKI